MSVISIQEKQGNVHKKAKQDKFDHKKIAVVVAQTIALLNTDNKITLDRQASNNECQSEDEGKTTCNRKIRQGEENVYRSNWAL